MKTLRHCFRVTTRLIAAPFIVAVLLVCACLLLGRGDETTTGSDHLAGLWLHLPAFLLSATCLGAALEAWPLYSRGRSGANLLLRLHRGPLKGCGTAASGTLAALAVSLLVAAMLFQAMLHGFGLVHHPVRARVSFITDQPVLDDRHLEVTLSTSSSLPIKSLRLKPAGYLGSDDIGPARIRVRANGNDLSDGWFSMSGGEVNVELDPPQVVQQLTFERHPDSSLFLVFLPGTVWGRSARTYGGVSNCALAILSYLLPTALALAVMAMGRHHLALPVGFAAGLATLGLSTLVELTPNNAAVRAFARGWWLPAEDLSGSTIRSLLAVGLVLCLAYLIGKLKRT